MLQQVAKIMGLCRAFNFWDQTNNSYILLLEQRTVSRQDLVLLLFAQSFSYVSVLLSVRTSLITRQNSLRIRREVGAKVVVQSLFFEK